LRKLLASPGRTSSRLRIAMCGTNTTRSNSLLNRHA
jgi:hypothetical protein